MQRILTAALLVALFSTTALANGMWYWADATGTEITDPINAAPGETVRVWAIARTNMSGWPPLNRVRQELWWDTAVIDNWSSGDPAVTITPFYNDDMGTSDPADDMVSDLCAGNYGAAEDYNFPAYNHYGKVDLWATIYVYGGMRIVGFDIPIRDDAPTGMTSLGSGFIGTDYWTGGVILSERIESDDEVFGLRINVVGTRDGDFTDSFGGLPDDIIDAYDIDALADAILNGGDIATFDLVIDGVLDSLDMDMLIQQLVDTTIVDAGEEFGFLTGTIYGDFNLDGTVNLLDLNKLTSNYNGLGGWTLGDANGDGGISLLDLNKLTANYNSTVVVPEPATIFVMACGAAAMIRRRRRA
jgi:hypothetical protein